MLWASVVVIGRILAESGSPPPDVHDPALLLIKRTDVVVGCTPGDGGMGGDAAVDAGDAGPPDAGLDAGLPDAGPMDAGVTDAPSDGAMPDAGTCTMIPGDAVTMIVQPNVATSVDGTRFAVLLVTPARPIVELQPGIFDELATLTAPIIERRTVEVPDPAYGTECAGWEYSGGGCGGGGGGGGDNPSWTPPPIRDAALGDGAVIEETIGPYQFIRAQPTDTGQLAGWLDGLGYAYMQGDLDAVAPYIELGYHVVAIRVALDAPQNANLTPVALTWPGSELRVPAALGHVTGVGPGLLTVYVAADQKYVLPFAKVRYAKPTGMTGMTFLTRNEIMLDQSKPVSEDPIAIHVDNLSFQEIETVTEEKRVPVKVDCSDDEGGGCCRDCSARSGTRYDLGLVVVAAALVLRRRRRSHRRGH